MAVILPMACYRGWVGRRGWGGDGVGGGEGWKARGGLYPPLGLFGIAMSPRSASYRPKHA